MLKHRLLVPLFALLALMGCAPQLKKAGPEPGQPSLSRAHFTASDGAVLPVRSWLPPDGHQPKAVVVALHGFNDYSHAFELPGRYLGAHGLAVYAYDQRGFGNAPGRGRWAGTSAYVRDLREFVGELRRRYGALPVYALGESMGGAIALVALADAQPPEVDGAILSAPAVWARGTMPWYQRALLSVAASTVPWMELTGSGLGIQASDNLEVLRAMGRDPLIIKGTRVDAIEGLADLMDAAQKDAAKLNRPALVLYGAKDQVIPAAPIRLFLDKLPQAPGFKVGFYPQGYHLLLRDLGAEQPWRDIAAWAVDRDGALPSGADLRAAAEFKHEEPGKAGAWSGQAGAVAGKGK